MKRISKERSPFFIHCAFNKISNVFIHEKKTTDILKHKTFLKNIETFFKVTKVEGIFFNLNV